MEAKELRIGNYVISGNKKLIRLCVVKGVITFPKEGLTVDYVDKIGSGSITGDISFFNHIPLTEKWLIKFGFEILLKELLFTIDNDLISISLTQSGKVSHTFTRIDNEIITIKYVHQLQNLYFALTGNELTIK